MSRFTDGLQFSTPGTIQFHSIIFKDPDLLLNIFLADSVLKMPAKPAAYVLNVLYNGSFKIREVPII